MVGIFTGAGSGLERGSVKQLGAFGLLGSAAFGRSGEQLFLNTATGSALIGDSDEFLVGRGPDAAIGRFYNSLGNATDENGDNWRQSTDRVIFGETGTRGTTGATVKRRSADGTEIVYTCNSSGVYIGTDGDGLPNTLTYASGIWTWTDGDTHMVETYEVSYASAAQWRLKQVIDKSAVAMTLSYVTNSDHVDKVTTADGGYIQYSWSGNNITQVVTHYTDLTTSTTKTLTRVRYAYDASNRLTSVTTDMTPDDNSVTDGVVYTATYTYDGTSTRVATITESDGTSIAIGYDATSHKVTSITQTVASGVTRVTGVAYTSSTLTTITDPLGQVTTIEYNSDGSLKKITAPPAVTGATAQTVQFTYDTSGNVLTVTDWAGRVTTYGGYTNGNWTTQTDPVGNVVTRTYDTANNMTSETRIGIDRVSNAGTHTTRYVYDSSNRLIWQLSAEGCVTKFDYDAYGQLRQTTNYQQSFYDVSGLGATTMVSDASLVSWTGAQTDKTLRIIDAITRDARGGVLTDTSYAAADSSGNAITTAGETIESFVYDQAGRLLTHYRNSENHEQFVYDGLGRMTASTDVNGGTTSFVFTDSTADNSTRTVVTTAAGYVQTYTYNRAGDLISMLEAGTGITSATTSYLYDALGRVRVMTDANSNKTYTLYDHAGRKTADVDSYGNVREYRYDAGNRVVATIRWNTPISSTNLTTLANPANTLEIATIRPASDAADIWSWAVYDTDGRMVETIEGDGSATAYEYDPSNQLVRTTVYANKLTSTQIGTIKTTPPATALLPTTSSNDSFSRQFFDKDGRLNAILDGDGYFTVYSYWTDGTKGVDKRYLPLSDPALRANGTFSQIGTSVVASVDRTFHVYDEAQRLRYTVDGVSVTEYVYNDGVTAASDTDKPRKVIHYNGTVTVSGTVNVATMQSLIATAGLASDPATRTTYLVYDGAERVAYSIDGTGAVTGFTYDTSGRLTKTVAYATARSTTSLPSLSTMASWVTANAGSSDRVSRTYYTSRGEVAYTIDGEGYVVGKAYDAMGHLVTEKSWDTPVSATDAWTYTSVGAAVSGTPVTTTYAYDFDGRVLTMRDGAGHGHDYVYYANGLLAWDIRMSGSATDESKTKYVYDAAGRLTDRYDGWTATSTATHYAYDGEGNQVSVTDPNGKTLTRTFDLNGQVLTETDPTGAVTTYQYDSRGNIVKVTDARGNSSYTYYDVSGRAVATRDAENYVTTTTYNAFNQIATATRHSARATNAASTTLPTWTWDGTDVPVTTTYEYDQLGRVKKVTDPLGNYSAINYNVFGEASAIRDSRGMLISEAYDKNGQLKTQVADTAGKAITTSYTYNARGQVLTATDANGKVTTSTYDAAGRLATVKDALNNTTTYTYDGRDNLVAVTDALGGITRTIYDANDRKVATIDALGGVVTYAYDADGHLVTQLEYKNRVATGSMAPQVAMSTLTPLLSTSTDDRTTRYAYDDDGRLRFTVDAKLHVAEAEYDAAGNVVRTTAYDGVIPGTSFTASGIATQVAALGGSPRTTRAVYDALGRQVYAIDPLGHVTFSVFDALDNVVKQVGYSIAYTSTGNPSAATMATWAASSPVVAGAANDRITRAWYDADSRQIYAIDALGYVTRTEYDAGSNVTKTTRYTEVYSASDATIAASLTSFYATPTAPQITQYTYDTAGRLTETLDGEGNKTRVTLSQTGQVLTSTSAADTGDAHVVTYTYDDVGRVLTQTVQIGTSPSGADLVTTNTYDAVGNLVKVHDARGNDTYSYYDLLGQQIASRDAESYVTETVYSTFGDVLSVTRHSLRATNTVSTTLASWTWATGTDVPATTLFEYDTLGQLTKSTDATGAYEQYTLGNFGERLSVRNKLGGTSTYTYDKAGNVLTETLPTGITTKNGGGTSIAVVNRYEYDSYGNRTKMVEADGAVEMRTTLYTYDKNDQLLTTVGDAVTVLSSSLVESSYTPTQTLTYDSRGNVIKSVDADAQTFFYYDRNDRLIAEISPVGTLSTFVYDGNGNKTSEKVFGTAVSLPGTPGGTPPTGSGAVRETRYAYDRANRLVSTTIPSLQTGEYVSGAWTFTTADLVSTMDYDANGNVLHQVDGRGASIRSYYDMLGRKIAQVDQERYLTVWDRDAEGNVTKETRYATALGSGTNIETATIAAMQTAGGTTGNRVTDFTYDKNGRRLTETRESVDYVAVDSSGTVTSGTASSVVAYTYDGLGHVLTKVEANGDTTAYAYDAIGRLTLETDQAFTDYLGATTTTPRTSFVYDGLNNLTSSRVQVDATGTNAADRITSYTYGAGGRLATMTDALSQTHIYGYDKAGRTVLDRYTRVKSDATSVTEAKVTLYDLAGRATTQTNARLSGSTWLFTSELTGNPAYDAVNMQYDAFGELTGRGLSAAGAGAAYQETFDYDAGGRLWRSNTGDGVLRFHVYDKAGNETLTLASAGANLSTLTASNYTASITSTGDTSTTDAVTTIAVFDRRGEQTATREPDRLLATGGSSVTVTHARTYNAFGEVLSETDALGYTTSYTYNSMGRMLSKISPQVSITSETGAVSNVNPTETYGYDLSGRLDRVTDANGNVTRRALLAGTGHGDSEALVTKEFHPDTGMFETRYDVFGDTRTIINELGYAETRNYDKLGQLVTQTHIMRADGTQLIDYFTYDQLGQRLTHRNSLYYAPIYVECTDYDYAGRVTAQVDFMGTAETYAYSAWNSALATTGLGTFGGRVKTTTNKSALTATETSDYFGRTIDHVDYGTHDYAYTFDLAGRLLTTTNNVGGSIANSWLNTGQISQTNADGTVSTYAYDAEGRVTAETIVAASVTVRAATMAYDAMGRRTAFADGPTTVTWDYDAVGNIRATRASYRPIGGSSNTATESWYKYDSMNRYVLAKGVLSGSTIVTGSSGVTVQWNVASQRVNENGTALTYTADGYLAADGYTTYTRDALGRMTGSIYATDTRTYGYNERGDLLYETSAYQPWNKYQTVYQYNNAAGVYQGGVVMSSTLDRWGYNPMTNQRIYLGQSTTTNTYTWWDSAQQNVSGGVSTFAYSGSGRITGVTVTGSPTRTIGYVTDAQGQIVRRTEAGAVTDVYYGIAGFSVGSVTNVGGASADFDQGYQPVAQDKSGIGAYAVQAGETLRTIAAKLWGDASLWFKLAEANGLSGVETLTVGQSLLIPPDVSSAHYNGDTFEPYDPNKAIGDISPNIAAPPVPTHKQSCGFIGQIIMIAIAVAVTIATHGAMAHLAGSILGVGSSTAGALVLGGALSGIAGSVASQAFGVASGTISKFSFKDIAMAGISGAIGGGFEAIGKAAQASQLASALKGADAVAKGVAGASKLGSVLGSVAEFVSKANFVGGAIRGLLGSALSQGIGVATGLQKKVDWVGVAAAGVGGGVSSAVHIPGVPSKIDQAVAGMAGGIANAATRSVLSGTDFGDNLLAALPDIIGSTIGNLVGGSINDTLARRAPRRTGDNASATPTASDLQTKIKGLAKMIGAIDNFTSDAAMHSHPASAAGDLDAIDPSAVGGFGHPGSIYLTLGRGGEEYYFSPEEMSGDMLALSAEDGKTQKAPDPDPRVPDRRTGLPVTAKDTHVLKADDTFWSLATADLGPGASADAIAHRAQQYMQTNPWLNPLDLEASEVIYVPTNDLKVGKEAAQLYKFIDENPDAILVIAQPRGLTDDDYRKVLPQLPGVNIDMIRAFGIVETGRAPYNADGSIRILFEPKHFSNLTHRIYDKTHPDISVTDDKLHKVVYGGFDDQYPKLDSAVLLNKTAALESASFGRFQMLGSNYSMPGYHTVDQMVAALQASQVNQLDAFVAYITHTPGLLNAMQRRDYATMARLYNGSGYKANSYDTKLMNTYNTLHQETLAKAKSKTGH